MTHQARRRLLLISSVLFLIIALVALAYSFGYRVTDEGIIVRTGGLFVAAIPTLEAQIYVNNELVRNTSLFSRSVFMQSLTPGVYNVRVERQGFRAWSKQIAVLPELVTEIRALLIPNPPETEVLASGDFVTLERWNDNTLRITGSSGRIRYFDTQNAVFISTDTRSASTTLPALPAAIAEYSTNIDYDGIVPEANGKRMLWWDGRSVWLEWLPNIKLPFYTKERTQRLIKTEHPVRNVMFYPRREAAIVTTRNEILVVEFDGRDYHIVTPLYKGRHPSVVLPHPSSQHIYVLDAGTLFRITLF